MKVSEILKLEPIVIWEKVSDVVVDYCQASKLQWDVLFKHIVQKNPEATELLKAFIETQYKAFVWAKFEMPDPEQYVTLGLTHTVEYKNYKKAVKNVRKAVTIIASALEPKKDDAEAAT